MLTELQLTKKKENFVTFKLLFLKNLYCCYFNSYVKKSQFDLLAIRSV